MSRKGSTMFVVAENLQFGRKIDLANLDRARNREHDRREIEDARDTRSDQPFGGILGTRG